MGSWGGNGWWRERERERERYQAGGARIKELFWRAKEVQKDNIFLFKAWTAQGKGIFPPLS